MQDEVPNRDYWNHIGLEGDAPACDLWRRHSDRINRSLIERWLPASSGRVLKTDLYDEALGEGLCAHLARLGSVVVGIDVSTQVRASAQRRHPWLVAVTADVRELPFADRVFDVIVSNSTLDHFSSESDIASAIRELARVLLPGGRLVLTLDNPANPVLWMRGRLPRSWLRSMRLVPYYVGATLSKERLVCLLTEAKLDVLAETATLHCPRVFVIPAAAWLSRRSKKLQFWFLRLLERFERLERLGTRYRTGHFVAAMACKPIEACTVEEAMAATCIESGVAGTKR